jgi:SAM-dependent methyltransferase
MWERENPLWPTIFFRLNFKNITVLDISETAIDVCKKRMGAAANKVHWLVADVTRTKLEPAVYDIWHDRAVFHFLTAMEQRVSYVSNVARSVKRGGHVIVSTFGPEAQRDAAVWKLCATTRSRCTANLVSGSVWWKAARNCITPRLVPRNNSSIAILESSERGSSDMLRGLIFYCGLVLTEG